MKLRYKYSEILLILGMILSCIVTVHIAGISANMWESMMLKNKYFFHYEYGIQHTDIVVKEATEDSLSYTTGNLTPIPFQTMKELTGAVPEDVFVSFNMIIGQSSRTLPVSIYFKTLNVLNVERRLNCDLEYCRENGIPSVYIGKSVFDYTDERDYGYCLELDGIYAVVEGILKCENLAGYDETILLDYSSSGRDIQTALERSFNDSLNSINEVKVLLCAKNQIADSELDGMAEDFYNKKMQLNVRDFYSMDENLNKVYSLYEIGFTVLLYVFVIVNLFMVCNLWFYERRDELKVRKMCGMNDGECVRLYAKDLMRLFLIALATGMPVILIIGIVLGDLSVSLVRIPITLIAMILFTGIILVFMILKALSNFRKQGFLGTEQI